MSLDELLERLRNKTTIGSKIHFYERDSGKYYELGEVVDEVSILEEDYKHFIQKIEKLEGGVGFRFCYFTINKKKTRMVFGQYASHMGEEKFKELIRKAKEKSFL